MALYEFRCTSHGNFEIIRPFSKAGDGASCPSCGKPARRIFSPSCINMSWKESLPYGKGSAGKFISHKETGGLDIYIPSGGSMEQSEVDYIAEGAKEKEISRVKKNKKQGGRNESQARLQAFANLARSTKKGQRAKVLKEAIGG